MVARCGARGGRIAALLVAALAPAQQRPVDEPERLAAIARLGVGHDTPAGGRLGLALAVRDASNDRCIAIVASHPDDQYLLPATFLRFNEGYRVSIVLLTRGEGGQNSSGPEVGDALSRLRTLETMICARRLGLEIEHVDLPDAGYSRSAEETLELWGADAATEALARALRTLRPDVVLTTHHAGDTHGHDLALLRILPAAVLASADARLAIDDLPAIPLPRVYRGTAPDEAAWFALATDDVDPDRGETYRDLAYEALIESHTSQAPFRSIDDFFAGANRFVGVQLDGAERPPIELHDGLPDLFSALRDRLPDARLADWRRRFDVLLPSSAFNRPALVDEALQLRDELRELELEPGAPAALRRARRIDALERIVLHGIGIRGRAHTGGSVAVPGRTERFEVAISSSGFVPLRSLGLAPIGSAATAPRIVTAADLTRPQPWRMTAELTIPTEAARLDPLRPGPAQQHFAMPLVVALRIGVELDGRVVELDYPLELPMVIRPPVELMVQPSVLLVADGDRPVRFNVRVRRHSDRPLDARLRVQLPPGFDVEPQFVDLALRGEPEQGHLFRLEVPSAMRPGPQPIRVTLGDVSARVELHRVALAFPAGLRIGLIEGVDEAARTVLSQLDCELIPLTEAILPTRSLDDLDTILIDVRALSLRESARAEFNRLLDFARGGGRLVILYHKDTEFDVAATGQRYFPPELNLRIGKGRVTREDAPIEWLLPDHRLLTTPNQIVADDWDGWSQERGLYFASEWSDGFEALLRIADPGEPAQDGALLYARVGRGEFIYCALALHRQLEHLHPGACRLFANLVAHRRDAAR